MHTEKKKLIIKTHLLSYLKEGEGIHLKEDTFLTGKELDGSDKVYGFKKEEGEILVITRGSSSGYSIMEMDKEDIEYMFDLSSVAEKIIKNKYSKA